MPPPPASPHRLGFTAAALVWAVSALAWLVVMGAMAAPATSAGWAPAVPARVMHALVFSLGPLPLFIAGFLLTAGPKWRRCAPLPARHWAAPLGGVAAGWLLAMGASTTSAHATAAGLALSALGWSLLLRALWRLATAAGSGERLHLALAGTGCAVVTASLWVAAAAVAGQDWASALAAARSGWWAGVMTVFVTASHRMLPLLGHSPWAALDRRWPQATLAWLLVAAWVPAATSWLPSAWIDHRAGTALLALHALLTGWHGGWLLWHWRRHPALRSPVLRLLALALGWWAAGWLMRAAALGLALTTPLPSPWPGALEVAALHAIALGFAGGSLLAMASRVAATQAGRSQAIDAWTHSLAWLLQAALTTRLLGALPGAATGWLVAAAAGWAAVALGWSARHGPWLLARSPPSR